MHQKHKCDDCVLSNKYLKFIDIAMQVTGNSRFPLYSCKYSKRTYTQHQLLRLILFKEYLGKDYRDIVEIVELMELIQSKLEIDKVSHFTTLHKFVIRLNSVLLNQIFQKLLRFFVHGVKQFRLPQLIPVDLQVVIVVTTIHGEQERKTEFCQNQHFS